MKGSFLMFNNVQKNSIPISGIKCEVKNCYYNDSNDRCMASEIEVGPMNAKDYSQTDCNTFKNKE
jgi:hypothetical protein